MPEIRRLPVEPRSALFDPTPQDLRDLTEAMPNCRTTAYGNVNVQTRVTARSKRSTFIVTDAPGATSDQTIGKDEGRRIAALQNEYLRSRDVVVVDGYIGNDPALRTRARLIVEKSNANIAAMQQILYYPLDAGRGGAGFEPELVVIDTPNLPAEGYPDDRLIAVDLERGVTRVLHSDYFGESKKGGLRMWNRLVYDRGGLALHAGCKVIPTGRGLKVALIVGLSGTGKTTTTFTKQNDSQPVQDDFLALMPDGRVVATENGCFAKTFGLDPSSEPVIHAAVTRPSAYLENVSQKGEALDFFDESYTQNGRAVIRMADVAGAFDARRIERADFLLILNRSETVIPAVARLDVTLGAAYFMLGETKGTSAGGADEEGKSLRVPGTNPFFPLPHALQGNRLLDLARRTGLEVYLMNTGRVGGPAGAPGSRKVKIRHSSAIVEAIAEGTIAWKRCPDFGYEIALSVPGIEGDDALLLDPRRLYERASRRDEYERLVARTKAERSQYMARWPGLARELVDAVSWRAVERGDP